MPRKKSSPKLPSYDYPIGHPAVDATDVPPAADGRSMKAVVLVCPECKEPGLWIESPDTTLKFGDPAEECQSCGYGLRELYPDIFGDGDDDVPPLFRTFLFDGFHVAFEAREAALNESLRASGKKAVPVLIGHDPHFEDGEVAQVANLQVFMLEGEGENEEIIHIGTVADVVTLDALVKLHKQLAEDPSRWVTAAIVKTGPREDDWGIEIDMKHPPEGMEPVVPSAILDYGR